MGIINNGVGQLNQLTDPFNDYNGKIGIEFRGSSSQGFPKKPYGIELQDLTGVGISASILGMPAEEDWTLNATYNDKSLMRDVLAYNLGGDLGHYVPRTRYCELVINNEYQGIYIVIEKIKRDKNRVDISKLDPTEISGDNLTGGYILKIDKNTGSSSSGFSSIVPPLNRSGSQSIYYQFEYPDYSDLASEQQTYIINYVRNFETILNGSTFSDPVNGYSKYIDINSFVDFLIINEISKNVDGYRISTYMHKDVNSKGGKLTVGPIWDYNLGYGNADYCNGYSTQGWAYDFNSECNNDDLLVPFWWKKLLTDPNFAAALGNRWSEVRKNILSTETIHNYMDSIVNVLNQGSQQRNFQKWPNLNEYVWPNYDWQAQTTYPLAVSWMKNWITQRMNWLDANMPEPTTVSVVKEVELTEDVSVYPNPFNDNIIFEYEIKKPGTIQIELQDIMGKSITTKAQTHQTPGKYQINFNNLNLPQGVYYGITNYNSLLVSTSKLFKR